MEDGQDEGARAGVRAQPLTQASRPDVGDRGVVEDAVRLLAVEDRGDG